MIEILVEPFAANPFLQRALVAALFTVVVTSLVGTWVVLRGLAFMGDAMAHGVVPGVALAFVVGFSPLLGATMAGLVMVGGISAVSRRSRLPQDTSIGLLFVGMLALGVTIISTKGAYAGDLTAILFGDAIGVGSTDVWIAVGAAAIALLVTVVAYRPFLALTFSEEKAEVLGFRPRLAHAAMLALVVGTVVVAFRTIGTLLVFAFLIAPPAAASLVARRVPVMMAVAVGLGWVAVVVGLLASFHLDTPASASIALAAVVEFFLILVGRDVVERTAARRTVPG